MTITEKETEILFQQNKVLYKGIIEDNNDPKQIARYRVRILGIHSQDKTLTPTETLPWAVSINPLIFGFDNGVGISSIAQIGTWVWCTFDNGDINSPIILGAIVGGSDINQLVKADYLNNHVIETKAGHYILFEDNGVVEIKHKSGKNIIIDSNGNVIINSADCNINSTGNVNIQTSGSGTFKSNGSMLIQGSTITLKSNSNTMNI